MFDASHFRREKNKAMMMIRAKLLDATRHWLKSHDYVEVHGPTLIPAVGYWPSSFEVKYFDKRAYLTQGLQPYANAFVESLGKIYTIAPTFRAEKLTTRRHLTEYWRIEVAQQSELDATIAIQEELLAHICHRLSEDKKALGCFNRFIEDLAELRIPFSKLTYDEAIDSLQRDGFDISWGQKLDWKFENHLSLGVSQPFFITKPPLDVEKFFFKSDPQKPELTLSADLIAPEGYGEIGSAVQRITEKEVILEKMIEENIDPADQQWYMSFMQNSRAPHSGFAIGLERLIQWICKLKHIKEATAFPRSYDSFYP